MRSSALLCAALVSGAILSSPPAADAARVAHKVSGPTVAGSDVDTPQSGALPRVSPDGEWIVYIQDAQTNNALALWAVRRTGGTPKRISGTLPIGGIFWNIRFTPDSRHVLYSADQETLGKMELYTVPLLGTAADGIKLNPPMPSDARAYNIELTEDGQRVVFNTQRAANNGHSLFSAPVDGSAPAVGLDGPFEADGRAVNYEIVDDRVVFIRLDTFSGDGDVWSTPIAGPATSGTRLSETLDAGGGVDDLRLDFSPDRTRVAFRARASAGAPLGLWIADVEGAAGSATALVVPDSNTKRVDTDFEFSADGTRVVFVADLDVDDMDELFSVAADGSGSPVQLNTGLIAAGDVRGSVICPGSSSVLYIADWAVDERDELFSVPAAGPSGASERLNRTLAAGETVSSALCLDDVLYTISDATNFLEVAGAPIGGPAAAGWTITGEALTTLRAPLGLGIETGRLVFGADLDQAGEYEVYVAPFDGSAAPEDLFAPLWTITQVTLANSGGFGPDEKEFFFIAALGDGPAHLYATLADGTQINPTRLSPDPASSGGVLDEALEVTPDGLGVLYLADAEVTTRAELHISDALVFAADFDEEGNLSEWSSSSP